jgi:hypothetical protein
MKFKREFLTEELGLPWFKEHKVEDKVIDNSRWSIDHELVFKYNDKFYQTYYSVGATECQDEHPWEYDDEVNCTEVIQQETKVMAWIPVKEDE